MPPGTWVHAKGWGGERATDLSVRPGDLGSPTNRTAHPRSCGGHPIVPIVATRRNELTYLLLCAGLTAARAGPAGATRLAATGRATPRHCWSIMLLAVLNVRQQATCSCCAELRDQQVGSTMRVAYVFCGRGCGKGPAALCSHPSCAATPTGHSGLDRTNHSSSSNRPVMHSSVRRSPSRPALNRRNNGSRSVRLRPPDTAVPAAASGDRIITAQHEHGGANPPPHRYQPSHAVPPGTCRCRPLPRGATAGPEPMPRSRQARSTRAAQHSATWTRPGPRR